MALFDLSIAEDLKLAAGVDKSVKILALHDDAFLIGPPSKLPAVYKAYVESMAAKGSLVQPKKSEFLYFGAEGKLSAEVRSWIAREGFQVRSEAARVAGGIVAKSEQAAAELVEDELRDHNKFFNRVRHGAMPSQHGVILLKRCGQPRFGFTVRATMPSVIQAGAVKFDASLIEALADKSNTPIEPRSKAHAQLSQPDSDAGMNMRRYEDVAPFAWWASQAACAPLLAKFEYRTSAQVEQEREWVLARIRSQAAQAFDGDKLQALESLLPRDAANFVNFYQANPAASKNLQAKLTLIATALRRAECEGASAQDAIRLKSLRAPDSPNRWHAIIPTAPHLRLSDNEVSQAMKRMLGQPPVPFAKMPDVCGRCKSQVGPNDSWHSLTCTHDSGRGKKTRHDAVVRELLHAIESRCDGRG